MTPAADIPSFRAVYDAHFRFVWRSMRRLGVPESDVADAVQDVFVVVHRQLPSFEGRSKLTTWLFGISYRVARDRQKLAYVRRIVDQPPTDRIDERVDVEAEAQRHQAAKILQQILEGLPFDQRVVFSFFELEGLSGEEVAELLQIPLGTVYSRLRLARAAFRRAVGRLHAQSEQCVGGMR